jgi:hypothetical protein
MKKNRIRLASGSEKLESRELLSGSSSAYCCCAPTTSQSSDSTPDYTATPNATESTATESATPSTESETPNDTQEASSSYTDTNDTQSTSTETEALSVSSQAPIVINNVNRIGGGFGRFGRFGLGGNGSFSQSNFGGNFGGNFGSGGEGGKKGRNAFFNRANFGSVSGPTAGIENSGSNLGFNGNFSGGFNGSFDANLTGGFESSAELESSVASSGTGGIVSDSGYETVTETANSSNFAGVTINNVNTVDGFAGFGASSGDFSGNFQGQFSGNVSGEFDTSIGSSREFNGNIYNLIKNNGSKLTYKNTSLQGGQRTVDFNTVTGTFKTHSPIVLDLDGSGGIETTGTSTAKHRVGGAVGQTVSFDINGDGTAENIEWLSGSGDGLLVDDRDGNAANNMNGNRLFGDANGQFSSGYEKLAKLDVDGDGVVSGTELDGLKIWIDNGDATLETNEMKSLAEVGVDQISVQRHDVTNSAGETLMQSVAQRNGQTILTEDVWFGQA